MLDAPLAHPDEAHPRVKGVAHHLIEADIWPYEPENGRGLLRHVVMRQSRTSGQVLITLVSTRKDPRLKEIRSSRTLLRSAKDSDAAAAPSRPW